MRQGHRWLRVVRYVWALPNTAAGLLFLPLAAGRSGRVRLVDGVVEAHGPLIAAALRRAIPIPGGAAAITFGHVVLGCDAAALEMTRTHERVHVRQGERWGPAFIPAYLLAGVWAWLTGAGAYEGNYFEREARSRPAVEGRHGGHPVHRQRLRPLPVYRVRRK